MRRFLAHYRVECALVLMVFLFCLLQAWIAWPQVLHGSEVMRWTPDTDPWLRLSLVRDWLQGGSWYDHTVAHSNAPYGGIASPWTRPLDIVIAGLAQLMQGPLNERLIKAALVLPPLWAALFVAGVLRAARRILSHPDHPILAFAMLVCLPMVWNYFGTANADHHALLAALFAWCASSLMGERLHAGEAVFAGVLLGLMLWISPEALFVIGCVLTFLGLYWLVTREGLREFFLLSLSLALSVTLAVMIERPVYAWRVPIYDSVSVVHVLALALAASAVGIVVLWPKRMVAVVASVAGLGVLYSVFPDFFRGPMVGLHPYITSHFLPHINEAKPLWAQASTVRACAMLWQPVLAVVAVLVLYTRRGPSLLAPRTRAFLAFMTVALVSLVLLQTRWYYYMAPFVALSLSVVLAPLFRPTHVSVDGRWPARVLAGEKEGFCVFVRQLAIFMVLLMPYAVLLAEPAPKRAETPVAKWDDYCESLAVAWIRSGGMQKTLGNEPRTVLASTNIGTQILYFTPYRIIASNYHREGEGIEYVWESMSVVEPADMQAYLAKRGVDILLLCPDAQSIKNSLLMRIYQGKAPIPPYLQRVEMQSMPNWRILPKKIYEPMLFTVQK